MHKAGLRATHATHLHPVKINFYDEPLHPIADSVGDHLPLRSEEYIQGLLIHTCAAPYQPESSYRHAQQTLVLSEFNMSPLTLGDHSAKIAQLGLLTVQLQLIEGDRFQEKPEWLLKDVVALLLCRPLVSVVLVYDPRLRIAGLTVEGYVTSASATVLPPQLLPRLRISHAVWDAKILIGDPFLVYVEMVARGRTLWNTGRSIESGRG